MLRVALTGGIATGKSYVLARLASLGVPTIDADALVHEALAAGSPAVARIAARFGQGILSPDGSVDRRALGTMVFADRSARADLEAILHPAVYRRIDDWFAAVAAGHATPGTQHSPAFAVADIPLLFETGHERDFDRVIVTACAPEFQVERLKKRNTLTDDEARQRMDAQMPMAEKMRRADYTIDTSGTFDDTDAQVSLVYAQIVRAARDSPA
jgi:dephospho-CoA kinase